MRENKTFKIKIFCAKIKPDKILTPHKLAVSSLSQKQEKQG
jgi:hypothetical protein